MNKSIHNVSPTTSALLVWLHEKTFPYSATFEELSEIAGRDVRQAAKGNLASAIRAEMRDGRKWANIFNTGIRLVQGDDLVKIGDNRGRIKSRRAVRRGMKDLHLAAAQISKLSPEGKALLYASLAVQSVIHSLGRKPALETISAELAKATEKTPNVAAILALFADKKK